MSRGISLPVSLEQRLEHRKGDERQTEEDAEEHQGAMFQTFAAVDLDTIEQPVGGQVQNDSGKREVDG